MRFSSFFKTTLSLLAFSLLSPAPLLAQLVRTPPMAEEKNAPQWLKEFSNLPKEKRQKYIEYFNAAEQLLQQKRIIECLLVTNELEDIFDKNPGLYNVKGSCYVEHKNYPKAQEFFLKAHEMDPQNPSVRFNLGEVYFISKQYDLSRKEFSKISQELDALVAKTDIPEEQKPNLAIRSLVDFKLYLIALALKDEKAALALEGKYSAMDDTPYSLCIEAVKSFRKKDITEAERKLQSAHSIYQKSGSFESFRDALTESGWIKSSNN